MKKSFAACLALPLAAMLGACTTKPPAEPLRAVRTVEIRYDTEGETNRYVGTVRARHEVDQAFRVGGKVAKRSVEVGQTVREGDVLGVLDDTDYRLAEEAARQQLVAATAQAAQAESDRKRLAALKIDGSVSVSDDEHAHSGARMTKAAAEAEAQKLELARNRLKYTVLRASQSGVVTAVQFEVGQVVAEGQPVVSIANEQEPEIVVDVPEDQLAAFKTAHYKASLASAPGDLFDVALREIAPQAAAQTRTYRARLKPVTAHALPLGATATLFVEHEGGAGEGRRHPRHRDHAGQWPAGGVGGTPRRGRGGRNGKPRSRRRCTAIATTQVLVSGPPAGELVVTAGVQKMAPGLRVALPAARAGHIRQAGRAMKSFNLSEWALGHRAIVLFLILVVGIAGVLSFTRLGQLEDPKFSVPSMTAMVIWPGATAQQMQDEVLNRMEKKFEQLDHFDKVVTLRAPGLRRHDDHREGRHVEDGPARGLVPGAQEVLRHPHELPEGVVGPIFNDEYGDVYGLLYAVKGDGIGQAELADIAEDIKRRLLKVPMVKKVDILGKQDKKVYVEFSHERLAALGITPLAIAESLKQPERHAARRLDRHARRPRVRARERPVHEPGRHPQRADRGRRAAHQARRHRDGHARLRGSADLHRSATTASRC